MKALALLLLAVAVRAEDAQTYIKKELAIYNKAPQYSKGVLVNQLWLVAQGTHRADVLNILALNEDEYTRLAVANNVTAPMSALRRLATDPSERVRGAVAQQGWRPLDQDIQWTLSNDSSRQVISDFTTQITISDIMEKIRARYSDDGEILWELAVNAPHADNATLQQIAHCRFHDAAELAKRALEKRGVDFAQLYEEKVVGIKR